MIRIGVVALMWFCVMTALLLALFALGLFGCGLYITFWRSAPLVGFGICLLAFFEACGAAAWLEEIDALADWQRRYEADGALR